MDNFTISRTFDAPRPLVFKCWVEPEHFEKWALAPAGCSCRLLHADVRPGGCYHVEQTGPDGGLFYFKVEFREISPVDQLVFVTSICNETGEVITHPSLPEWPARLLTTVNFEVDGEGTRLTVIWELMEAAPAQAAFFMGNQQIGRQGWTESLNRLQQTIEQAESVGSSS